MKMLKTFRGKYFEQNFCFVNIQHWNVFNRQPFTESITHWNFWDASDYSPQTQLLPLTATVWKQPSYVIQVKTIILNLANEAVDIVKFWANKIHLIPCQLHEEEAADLLVTVN